MTEKKYVVGKRRSIVTKMGIKGELEPITRQMIGKNFDALVEKGIIIEEAEIVVEKPKEITPVATYHEEEIKETEKEIESPDTSNIEPERTGRRGRKKNSFGAKKKEDEKETVIEDPIGNEI